MHFQNHLLQIINSFMFLQSEWCLPKGDWGYWWNITYPDRDLLNSMWYETTWSIKRMLGISRKVNLRYTRSFRCLQLCILNWCSELSFFKKKELTTSFRSLISCFALLAMSVLSFKVRVDQSPCVLHSSHLVQHLETMWTLDGQHGSRAMPVKL